MQKKGSGRKSLIIGIVAAIVVLGAVLALVLTQCTGQGESTAPSTTVETTPEVPTYELYWNLDRELYDGKSEAGMSSRMPESDGFFHVRFSLNGEEVTLKVQDRKLINKIDVTSIMGLVFDENGVVIDVMDIKEMPVERLAWQFYVQSAGKTLIKANSSDTYAGMEVQLELNESSGVYDMTGKEGAVGCVANPMEGDRIMAVANLAGEVTHVFIYERPNYMLTHEAECQHCEKVVTWYEWVREDKLPVKSGHYQLQNDIKLSGQMSMSEQDQKICLDLNGKRVDGKSGTRMYSLHNAGSHLAIMDTSEGQTGVMAAHGTLSAQGGVVWVRYGQFHFYSGTLDASDATTKYYGTAVTVPKNTYFYMHGGTIIGGTATWVKNAETGAYSRGYGGAMYVGGKFVMNDGEIRDGFAKSVTYKKNGSSTTTRGYGGNIFVGGTAEVELNGGVIKNGKAGSAGGNLYLDGSCSVTLNGTKIQGGLITGKGKNGGSIYIGSKASLVMKSGSISGGTSYNAGGNIYLNGKFTMSGGSISGGKVYSYTTKKLNPDNTNYNLFVVNGTFKMYGGRIYGGVGVTDTSSTDNKTAYVGLATYATIKSDEEGAKNLTLNTGGIINCRVDTLRDSASIGINTARGLFTAPTLEANKDKFFSDIPEAEVIYTENGLFLGRQNCVCGKETHINGCDGTQYLWAPWTSKTSLPKTNGNYFLLKDVTTTTQYVVAKGETVRLDMNGHNVTYNVSPLSSDGYRVYRSAFESLLVITDTTDNPGTMRSEMPSEAEVLAAVQAKLDDGSYDQAKADQIIAAQKAGNFGQVLWARGGDIILHNGIMDGSNLNGSKSGMTVYVAANTASEDGGVTRKGSFTMYGGVIKGATSTSYGCSLYGSSNSVIKIHGGEIVGGTSTASGGGNAYVFGEFYMDGGVIRDGKAYSSGGNLVVEGAKAVATITGTAQILNGQAGDPTLEKDIGRGGNIRVVTKGAKLTLGGDALVSGGIAYRSASNNGGYAGNISVNTDTTMIMTGGTVEGGESYRGGNIDVCGSLTISGGTITGGKAIYGGNIYVLNGTGRELIMEDGLIEKGHATTAGGNIYALAPVTITGGVIAEGKAHPDNGVSASGNHGGNIYTFSKLDISGDAVIRDGYAGAYGGNISGAVDGSLKADITISGDAQILNGTADGQKVDEFDGGYGGNIRLASNTSLTMKDNVLLAGGNAIGGKYNSTTKKGGGGQGGNLYMVNADVQILGGVIENGTASGGGGNIGCNSKTGTLLLQDVIVRDGDTGSSYGGNIRLRAGGIQLLEITGNTQILGGKASEGGNIYINAESGAATVEVSGNALITGGNVGSSANGPTIYLNKNADFTVTGNAVIDATEAVGKRGGAVYMYDGSSSLTVDGNAKLLGTKHDAMTHGGVGYLRGDVTIGGNTQIIAGDNGSYGNAIYFYSGNLTLKDDALVDASGTTCTNGTALYVYSTSNVTVEGRVVLNGGQTTGAGGTVFVENATSTLSFTGATIDGGKAGSSGGNIYTKSDLTLTDTVIRDGEAGTGSGGNLYITGCDVTMTGGYITGGTNGKTYSGSSKPNGGNVYISSSATFTLNSGSVEGGKTINTGGNIVCYGKFVMNGGQIFGGCKINSDGTIASSNSSNGNVYVVNADMEMHGGHIDGGVAVYGESTLKLSGNPSMTSSYEGDDANELFINGAAQSVIIEGTLTTEGRFAKVRSGSNSDRIFSAETIADNAAFFEAYTEGESVFLNGENKLEIGKIMCICGFKNGKHIGDCDGTEYKWSAWTGTEYLPTTSGYWYLTADLETAGTTAVTSNNQKIALDLNGYTIYSTKGASRVFSTYKNSTYWSGTELTLLNSGDTGLIQGWNKGGTGKTQSENGVIWASSRDTVINLYNVIIDCSANKGASDSKYGMCISATGTASKVNVFSSQLLGGTAYKGDALSLTDKDDKLDEQVIRLEGDVVITGTEGSSVWLGGEGNRIDVSKLTSLNAPIAIEATGVFTTGWNKDANIGDFFVSGTEDGTIVLEGDELAMRPYHCLCGQPDGKHVEGFCDGTKYTWQPWTSTDVVPTTTGHYYLVDDITTSKYNTISTKQDIVIDLNGHTINSKTSRLYTTQYTTDRSVPVNIVLTNTAEGEATIKLLSGKNGDQGRIVWLSGYNKSVKAYNLTLDLTEGLTGVSGLAFSINTQVSGDDKVSTLEVYNTVFEGPTKDSGGVGSMISVTKGIGASVKLQDVTMTGGYGYKYASGGNTEFKGGAIYMGIGSLSMKNVSVTGAEAAADGGAIYMGASAKASFSGKVVIEGKLTDGTSSGIFLTEGATIDVADLAEGSKITVTGSNGVISANTYEETDPDLQYLDTDLDDQYLLLSEGKLYLKASTCICGATDGNHVEGFCDGTVVKWTPWNSNKAPTESGNYFLTKDVTFSGTANMSTTDGNIVIDLNGYDITVPAADSASSAGRMYTTYTSAGSTSNVNIKITNTSTNASTLAVEGGGDEGRIMWLTGSNKSLAMNNIEVDISTATINKELRKDGLAVNVAGSGNTFKAFNCTVTGGTSTSNGNFLYVGYGNTATMKGCTVTDTKVIQGTKDGAASGGYGGFAYIRGTLNLTNCTVTGATGEKGSGAIYAYGNGNDEFAQLNISGCTFENCAASSGYAGAINLAAQAEATIKNSKFKSCSAKGRAGAIHVATDCVLTMEGSTIEGCTDTARAGAIYSYDGYVTLIDCTLKNNSATGSTAKGGAIYLYGADITLGGKTVITGNKAGDSASNLYLNGRKVLVSTEKPLADSSVIGVSPETGYKPTISTTVSYAQKDLFVSDLDTLQIVYDGTNLKFADAAEHWHCVCGGQPTGDPDHVCKDIKFTAIDALAGGSKLASGNYYLTGDATVSGTSYVGFEANATVNFCVAGHTVTGNNKHRVFFAGTDVPVTFTLTSCGENADKGTLKNASQRESNIVGFYNTSSVFNMYNVTLDASEAAYTAKSWGTVINSKSTFNMYSGTIIGSKSSENLAATGNVSVGAGSVMNMYGGTITGGTCASTYATAGNIYVAGTLNMYGGTITGGKIGTNANSYIANMQVIASGKLNMSGGVIDGHVYAGKAGATVNLSGNAKILDADNRSLWIITGNTNLFIGKMEEGARINVLVKDSSDADVTGVFASGLNDYKLTEADLAYFKVTNTSGVQVANVALNDDNTVSAVAMN